MLLLLGGLSVDAVLVRLGRETCAQLDTNGPTVDKPRPRATVFRVKTRERMRQPGWIRDARSVVAACTTP